MEDLVRWLGACLDTDELWATEASRQRGGQPHPGGAHWQWVEPETDTPVMADPSRDEHLTDEAENFRFSLRSVEEFPREHVGPLPLFAIRDAEEIPVAVAGHIAAHDPARVLRETDAKRKLLDDHPIVPRDVEPTVINGEEFGGPYYPFGCGNCHAEPDSPEVNGFGYCLTWRVLASVYADRLGYREEWRP